MNIRLLFLIPLVLCLSARAQSQDSEANRTQDYNGLYYQANEAFELGEFELVDSLLRGIVPSMKGEQRINAYRLLALSNLNMDRPEEAANYVGEILSIDPYYTAYGESPRFIDLIAQMKKGQATIWAASKLSETPEEVPVPVTLITEEMIRASGARTLSDLLLLYVPGISAIGSIENNLAMRGVYGMSQETMLVMVDGHRMNSSSTNAEALDYRHDLEKIKQIEVLRGPASSLYGNVALTAVVNIITKQGGELGGATLTAKAGTHQTFGGSLLYGQGNLQSDMLAWASVYSSVGQARWEDNSNTIYSLLSPLRTKRYIDGYNNKPAFDFGAKLRWGDFKIEAIGSHAKLVPYHNLVSFFNAYSYDNYSKQNGEKPGTSRTNIRIDLDYNHAFSGKFALSFNAFATMERIQLYNVMGDSINETLSASLLQEIGLGSHVEPHSRGLWQAANWEDYGFGGSASGTYSYSIPRYGMYGSIVGGVQYENFVMTNASLKLGSNYSEVFFYNNQIFYTKSEHTLSAFAQLKHNFTRRLIFNGGLRYDYKIRQDSRRLSTLSPRISLIWLANSVVSLKAGYSHSFVDAPYFYRASELPFFSSGSDLEPEKMDAIQIGASFKWEPIKLRYEVNLFCNSVVDLVYYNSENVAFNSTSFSNTGKINMLGIENVLQYTSDNTLANLNLTYQYPTRVENFSSDAHNVSNVPKFIANLTAAQRCINSKRAGQLWVRANMHMQSAMECLNNDLFIWVMASMSDISVIPTITQQAFAIFGAGVEWRLPFGLTASVDTYNLLNTDYRIGGQLQDGVPGAGFSLLGKLSYKF